MIRQAAVLAWLAAPAAWATACAQAPDSTAGLRAAAAARVDLVVPPGDYRLDGVVMPLPGHTWELTGTRFSGGGMIADAGDWSPFLARLGKGWIKHDADAGNAFGTMTALTIGITGAAAAYEKAAGYDFVITADPSTYTGSGLAMADLVTKDAVARQMSAVIRPGNMSGRVWGLTAMGQVLAGADGAAAAAEFDAYNDGSDQPLAGQPTSKTGIGIIALGHARSTVAIIVAPGSTQFHDGLLIRQEAVADTAIRVTAPGSLTENVFAVTPSGDVVGRTLSLRGHLAGTGGPAPRANAGALAPGSSDMRGAVELPAGTAGVTLTFADPFPAPPFCVVSGSSVTTTKAVTAATAATLTLARSASPAAETITWHCIE